MRIAVCFSGQIRTGVETSQNLKRYFGELYPFCDFFIHTWNLDTDNKNNDSYQIIDDEKINKIKKIYNPKKFKIEDYHQVDQTEKFHFGCYEHTIVPELFYSFRESINLKKEYEIENNFIYDYVIKIRFDLIFPPERSLKYEINELSYDNSILIENGPVDQYNWNGFVDDVFFIANSHIMDYVAEYYSELKNSLIKILEEKNYNQIIEYKLINHINHKNIKILVPFHDEKFKFKKGRFSGYTIYVKKALNYSPLTQWDECQKIYLDKKEKLRIAVCLSGQPRTWRTAYKNIKNFFDLDNVETDFFIHTWDTNTYRNIDEPAEMKTDYILSESEETEIKECFNPIYMIYEKYDKSKFNSWSPLFYSFYKSVFLKRKYEIENDFVYDIVIKTRFDINFKQEGLNNKNARLDKFYIHPIFPMNAYNANELFELKFNIEFNATHFDDVFFYADSATMDIISKCYFWHLKIMERGKMESAKNISIKENEYFYGPGTLLYSFLLMNNIHPLSHVCTPYYVVRKEAEEQNLDSISDWQKIHELSHEFYWEVRKKGIL